MRDAPADVVGAVLADAQANNVTFQEAAVRVLAARFKVRRVASDRQFVSGTRGGSELHLEVPVDLRRKIRQEAARVDGNTMRGVVLAALADHYGLGSVASGRRPRGGS